MADTVENVRVWQLNCHNSRSVTGELEQLLTEQQPDIILLQEQHSGLLTTDMTNYNVHYISDKSFTTILTNKNLPTMLLTTLTNDYSTTVQVGQIYFVSAYFKFNEDIEGHLQNLQNIQNTLQNRTIVYGLDANARSTEWYNDTTNRRGRQMEAFINTNNLLIQNQRGQIPTYGDTMGNTSNIDLTLTTRREITVTDWTTNDETTSDHRLIKFTVQITNMRQNVGQDVPVRRRYNLRRADWREFNKQLRQNIDNLTTLINIDTERGAKELTKIIQDTADKTIPVYTDRQVQNGWWDRELETERKRTRNMATYFYRNQTLRNRIRYTDQRNKYTGLVRQKKTDYFRRQIETDGNSDPYKFIRKHCYKTKTQVLTNIVDDDGIIHTDISECVNIILDKVLITDDPRHDTERERMLRQNRHNILNTPDAVLPTKDEIQKLLKTMKNKKSPGPDNITTELLRGAWGALGETITMLFRRLLTEGTYPTIWKQGQIKLIKKPTADQTRIKSFRPLTLLPIPGKLYEQVIAERLRVHIETNGLYSDRQFGFVPGKGTTDALIFIKRHLHNDSRLTLAVYLDITGAFDNAWWPLILDRLRETNCPANIYRTIDSYLDNRTIQYMDNKLNIRRQITTGCPQGSILAPILWNLLIDPILRLDLGPKVTIMAYADDCILLIDGQSRRELEQTTNITLTRLTEWGRNNRLSFSSDKTRMTYLKGRQRRPPTVQLGNTRVRYAKTHKVLGLNITERFKFTEHITMTGDKARLTFTKLKNITNKRWGLDSRTLTLLYKSIFVGRILYAAPVWADRLTLNDKRLLRSSQRLALITVTKAYRTCSLDSLTTIAGVPPLDLLALTRLETYNVKREGGDRQQLKLIKDRLMTRWQEEWDNSDKGRFTYRLLPDIRTRLKLTKLRLNFYVTQGLTGHGNFQSKLHDMRLVDNPNCRHCGQLDTPEHALFTCTLLTTNLNITDMTPLNTDDRVNRYTQQVTIALRLRD